MSFARSFNKLLSFFVVIYSFLFSSQLQAFVHEGADSLDIVNVHIFGDDDRRVEQQSIYAQKPYKMLVKVGLGCTGALVAEDLVLTNYHCVRSAFKVNTQGQIVAKGRGINVFSEFHRGNYRQRTKGFQAYWESDNSGKYKASPSSDWAIIRLREPLGKTQGYFGFVEEIPSTNGLDVNLSGFSVDQSMGRVLSTHNNCEVKYVENSFFGHNCDSMKGSSGSPIWIANRGRYYIIGLHYGQLRVQGVRPAVGVRRASGFDGIEFQRNFSNLGVRPRMYSGELKRQKRSSGSVSL